MSAMPNLFLKWRLFRELFDMPRSDREIAIAYWGPNEGPSRFSKMLRGDYGVSADAAAMIAEVVDKRIATWRAARGAAAPSEAAAISASDLALPAGPFVRRLLAAAGPVDGDALDRAQRLAMEELTPRASSEGAPARLLIERYRRERVFAPMEGAGSDLVQFDPASDLGQLTVELSATEPKQPHYLYVMITRDASTAGQRFWELPFSETVWWLRSPFVPAFVDGHRIALMHEPQPVTPLPGRYRATAVLVFDADVLPRLDPRGGDAGDLSPCLPDEDLTLRFLTKLGRVVARTPEAVCVARADYEIVGPRPSDTT